MTTLTGHIRCWNIPKKFAGISGDVIDSYKTRYAITLAHADGKGSGIAAHLAATLAVSRILALVKEGMSIRKIAEKMTQTMLEAKNRDEPFSAFRIVRLLADGTVFHYAFEMPPLLMFKNHRVSRLKGKKNWYDHLFSEEHLFSLRSGEGLISLSDGIVMAGLGKNSREGWGIPGIIHYLNLQPGRTLQEAPDGDALIHEAVARWGGFPGDDCSVTFLRAREAKTVHILTGPPSAKQRDYDYLKKFFSREGEKIVCGGTTAKLASHFLRKPLKITEEANLFGLPRYELEGVDLVTEGVITLNMVYHLLDDVQHRKYPFTPAVLMAEKILEADMICIQAGMAQNPSLDDVEFKQLNILQRKTIIPLLQKRLEELGKVVEVEWW